MSRSKAVAVARPSMAVPTAVLAAGALVAAVAAALPQPAQAQSRAPQGSYLNSCRAVSVSGPIVRAECRDPNSGNWRRSELDYTNCRGSDVFNFRGVLSCSGDPRNNRPDLDGPSYDDRGRYDRRDDRWDDRRDRRDDRWDGRRDRWDRRGGAITVYEDAGFRGRSVTFRDDISDLRHTGLNDRISSMRLQGTWEACSDAWFRGECRRFRGDAYDLQAERFNDRISSLRRVR